MSTMIFKEEEIIQMSTIDAELINKALIVSKSLGIAAIKNSIQSYKQLIQSHKCDFVPHLDLDYRTYIIKLLKIATESASEENKAIIFSEIVIPS